jgi:Holliday junction resolvase RusA-like endonuclease
MRRRVGTPEYRIVVPGRAVSFRSPSASAYKRTVAALAKRVFKQPLKGQLVEFLIDYFHADKRRMDMDNVAKTVLDALNTIAYRDDQQVRLVSARAHSLAAPLRIWGGPADLVKPLQKHSFYVFLRVRAPSISFEPPGRSRSQ